MNVVCLALHEVSVECRSLIGAWYQTVTQKFYTHKLRHHHCIVANVRASSLLSEVVAVKLEVIKWPIFDHE